MNQGVFCTAPSTTKAEDHRPGQDSGAPRAQSTSKPLQRSPIEEEVRSLNLCQPYRKITKVEETTYIKHSAPRTRRTGETKLPLRRSSLSSTVIKAFNSKFTVKTQAQVEAPPLSSTQKTPLSSTLKAPPSSTLKVPQSGSPHQIQRSGRTQVSHLTRQLSRKFSQKMNNSLEMLDDSDFPFPFRNKTVSFLML